jgi:cell division protein ZapA
MNDDKSAVTVHILDREYQIGCLPEEREPLLDSARYLNSKMREIRDGGKVIGLDRIAVMAALNITHEMLEAKSAGGTGSVDIQQRLRDVQIKLEAALQEDRQLEL